MSHILKKILLWSVVVTTWIIVIEVFFRFSYELLPQPVSNELATGYHGGFTGIYRRDTPTHLQLMKPNFEREMYFNGYRWHHKTDWNGFRNPTDRYRANVVLLGDSMIYGHGVDEPHTVSHHLEKNTGLSVSNLGTQGASAHQEYQLMKSAVLDLKPKFVFMFFLTNDIRDLTFYLTDEQMNRSIAQQSDFQNIEYFEAFEKPLWRQFFSIFQDLYVARAGYMLLQMLGVSFAPSAEASTNQYGSLPLFIENPRLKVAMDFHLDAMNKMSILAAENDIRFTEVFIYTGNKYWASEEPIYEKILQDFCDTHKIPFLNLREYFDDRMHEGFFLENDGHFTDRGAQLVAEIVADNIGKY